MLRRINAVLVAAAAATLTGAMGATFTDLGPWYQQLAKPDWKPPDVVFGPMWTLIFALAAAAGVIAWRRSRSEDERQRILLLFAANGTLNVLWSLLFFTLKRPDWALWEVGALWLSIVALIAGLAPIARLAGWLLAPYLVWVSVAAAMNYEIVRLNPPFG